MTTYSDRVFDRSFPFCRWLNLSLFAAAIFVAVLTIPMFHALALEREYERAFTDPDNCLINGNHWGRAGYMENLYFKYDNATEQLRMEVDLTACEGVLPDGYWIVINDGPLPASDSAGEVVIFYVDGSEDLENPKVTVYAYSGEARFESYKYALTDGGGSFLPPDRLLTNLVGDSSGWLNEASLTGNFPNRKIVLDLNIQTIKEHFPTYPPAICAGDPSTCWFGSGFGELIGMWFHTQAGITAEYCGENDPDEVCQNVLPGQSSVGFLKSFASEIFGWYDAGGHPTNDLPYCIYSIVGPDGEESDYSPDECTEVKLGDSISLKIKAIDADSLPITVMYPDDIPVSANVSLPSGSQGFGSPFEIGFTFGPNVINENQSLEIPITFIDSDDSVVDCPVKVCVPENEDPVCNISFMNQDEDQQCEGVTTTVAITSEGSYDPDEFDSIKSYYWTTDCTNVDGLPEQLTVGGFPITQTVIGGTTATVSLTNPGRGQSESCTVSLTVKDQYGQSSTCSVDVEVPPCELDCLSQPLGIAQVDQCGVCDGDGKSCLDCADTPFGTLTVDQCGICGGSDGCLDCAGKPFGTAVPDRCGVCEGDGFSCLECETTNILELQFLLDGGLGAQERQVIRQLDNLAKLDKRPNTVQFIQETLAAAIQANINSWTGIWSIPNTVTNCTEESACVTVATTSVSDALRADSDLLFELNRAVLKRVKRRKERKLRLKNASARAFTRLNRRIRKLRKAGLEARDLIRDNIGLVPSEFSDCSLD